MKQFLRSKNKQLKPHYDGSIEEQTMLYWRLQAQWNHREVVGYAWPTGDALRLLNTMASNTDLPYALRRSADKLNLAIIMNAKVPKPKLRQPGEKVIPTILTLPSF